MALIKWDALITPLRGLIGGAVFQTGKYGDVVKTKKSGQGQLLRPQLDSQAALSHLSGLWAQLSPAEQANWTAAIPSFPTYDRYGNVVSSSAQNLFYRTVGLLPLKDQIPLALPRAAYTGSALTDSTLDYDGTTLTFEPSPCPVGEALSVALFVTIQNGLGKSYAKPSFRRLYFLENYSGAPSIDLTAEYEALMGEFVEGTQFFFCSKVYNYNTPELLNEVCDSVIIPVTPGLFLDDFGMTCHLAFAYQRLTSYASESCLSTYAAGPKPEIRFNGNVIDGNSEIWVSGAPSGSTVSNYVSKPKQYYWFEQMSGGSNFLFGGNNNGWMNGDFTNDTPNEWYFQPNSSTSIVLDAAINHAPPLYAHFRMLPANNTGYKYIPNFANAGIGLSLYQRRPATAPAPRIRGTSSFVFSGVPVSAWHDVEIIFDGANSEVYIDGVLDASGNIGVGMNATGLRLGTYQSFQHLLLFAGVPTPAQRTQINDYFDNFYA